MFLKKLKPENQEKFLKLACILCHADGTYSERERQMMRLYAAEFEREDGVTIIELIIRQGKKTFSWHIVLEV